MSKHDLERELDIAQGQAEGVSAVVEQLRAERDRWKACNEVAESMLTDTQAESRERLLRAERAEERARAAEHQLDYFTEQIKESTEKILAERDSLQARNAALEQQLSECAQIAEDRAKREERDCSFIAAEACEAVADAIRARSEKEGKR